MKVEELVKELRSWADCDARSGEPLGARMRKAADKLEELAAENERLSLDSLKIGDEMLAETFRAERLEAALAEKDKELKVLRVDQKAYKEIVQHLTERAETAEAKNVIAGKALAEKDKDIAALREALEKLLACPAIADENHNDASWGCPDTAAAISFARAALKEVSDD